MAKYPDAQRKAQEELDDVLGSERLPEHSDIKRLPYIRAVLLESLRWMPALPLGVPHRVMVDDEYNGYRIPKGSTIIAVRRFTTRSANTLGLIGALNLMNHRMPGESITPLRMFRVQLKSGLPTSYMYRAMLHNPEDYPNPGVFNPDRFVRNGELDPDVRDPSTIAFGFGRRICAGRHLANDILFLFMASILYAFNIEPASDANGNSVPVEPQPTSGQILYLDNIPCVLKPRSVTAERLIHKSELL
ncbi:hypothetical protein PHLCEN_2v10663 [Hermanssonia centrifuga]|uniref:Cytochrome P450 n=1 Tax=Hermanssonia centrifuga TaxID=98765 RepID=A0A2R6NLX5_9APHY|nr:hypothetical protein PHLCEN_2v10663 [Hermanssonia centrifuga]